MLIPPCDVVGCHAQAEWRCPLSPNQLTANLEEYLCDQHHAELQHHRPSLASLYEQLVGPEGGDTASPASPELDRYSYNSMSIIGIEDSLP